MKKFYDTVVDQATGQPRQGATVTVTDGTGAAVQLYSDNGVTPIENPINQVTTDVNGLFQFYVANGTYAFKIQYAGATPVTITGIQIYEEVQVINALGTSTTAAPSQGAVNTAINAIVVDSLGTSTTNAPSQNALAISSAAAGIGASDGTTVQANLDNGSSFIQPQTGGVRRTGLDKFKGFVDVRDYMTDADRVSVEAGTLVDTSYAFQAAFDACSGKASASTQFGRKLRVPAGRYLINSAVLFTWRNSGSIIDAGDHRKLTIEGDGSANTVIFCDVGNTSAFNIQGYGTGDGTKLDLTIQGLSIFEKDLGSNRTGTGLRTKQITRVWLQDVVVNYFNVGFDFSDAIYVCALNCEFGGNNGGATAALSAFSNPNVATFLRCNFGGNQVYGLQATAAANLHVLNCAFEGIGTDNTAGTDQACVHLINGPSEGGHQATIQNCYFENNQVYADVRVEWNSTNRGTLTIAGNSFRRSDPTRFATRHIAMSQVSTGNMYVNLDGNSYKTSGTYTPGSNPCWEVLSTKILIDPRNEQYTTGELYALNNLPALRNCGLEIVAEGFVNSDGTTTKLVNCSVSKSGTGQYAITFTNPPVDANYHINARTSNAFGHVTYSSNSTSGVTILTADAAGNSADKTFDFTVVGRRIA